MRSWLSRVVLAAATAAVLATPAQASEIAVGLRYSDVAPFGPELYTFSVDSPATLLTGPVPVTGLFPDERPAAIDFRPDPPGLYMLAPNENASSGGHLYRLDPLTGVATPVGPSISQLTLDITWDIDFDPVSGDIRVLAGYTDDRHFRLDPDTGMQSIPDTPLEFPPGDPNEGANPDAAAGAYTNSVPGATSTTAYVIDRPILARLGSPGGSPMPATSGVLTTIGLFASGNESYTPEGLDISGATGRAYALVLQPTANPELEFGEISLENASMGPRTVPPSRPTDIALLPTSVVRLGAPSAAPVAEGATLTVPVERGGTGTGPVTVAWSVGPDGAGQDLGAMSGTVAFGQGETSKPIEIPVIDDRTREDAEAFVLSLGAAAGSTTEGAVMGQPAQANLTVAASAAGAGPRVGIRPRRVRLNRRGRARLRVSCPAGADQACTGTLKLQRGSAGGKGGSARIRVLGRRGFNVAAGRTARVTIRVKRRFRRRVAHKGRLGATAVVTARDAISADATSRRRIVLLPPR